MRRTVAVLLNYWASGTTHGPGGVDQPSVELRRALELPATWTDYLIQKDDYGGSEPKRANPVAYFESDPAKPTTTNTVTFDASFSRTEGGTRNGLRYFWDFGDGTTRATTSPTVTHTFPSTSPHWYDVKLAGPVRVDLGLLPAGARGRVPADALPGHVRSAGAGTADHGRVRDADARRADGSQGRGRAGVRVVTSGLAFRLCTAEGSIRPARRYVDTTTAVI